MIDTGLPGVTLDDREHVCVFHRGPAERDAVLAAFFGAGLAGDEKCLCVADSTDTGAVTERLDPQRRGRPGQLTVLPATAYLTDGRFVPRRVYSQWDSIIGAGVDDDGYRHVRGTGELSWFLRHHRATGGAASGPGTDGAAPLLEYEALCNKLVKRRPATIFCLYDLDLLDAGLLPGVLRYHPAAIARGVLFRAPRPLPENDEPPVDGLGGHPWRIEERPGGANDALLLANLLLAGARNREEIDGLLDGLRRAVLDPAPAAGADAGADAGAGAGPQDPERPEGPEAQRFLQALAGLAAPHLRAAELERELATRPPAGTSDAGAAELARCLLDGTPLDPAGEERARSVGLDLDAPLRAVVVRPATVVRDELTARGVRFVAVRPGEVAFLAGDGPDLDPILAGLAELAGLGGLAGLAGPAGERRVVGVGRAHTGAAGAARSYAEARRAADFAAGLDRPVLRHEDLGLFSLLADGGDPGPMADLVAEWLGPLLTHDGRRRPPLLPTLAAYLDAGAAQQATADALGVHVSTLKYRLGRIEAVTGRDLSAPSVRFQLQVALAAHRTLSVLRSTP